MDMTLHGLPFAPSGETESDARRYIHLMSSHLMKVADGEGLEFIAYLLSMVTEEAGKDEAKAAGKPTRKRA